MAGHLVMSEPHRYLSVRVATGYRDRFLCSQIECTRLSDWDVARAWCNILALYWHLGRQPGSVRCRLSSNYRADAIPYNRLFLLRKLTSVWCIAPWSGMVASMVLLCNTGNLIGR